MSIRFFDKQLELRNLADGAEASTVAETAVALEVLKAGTFKVVFVVTALDLSSGNETYSLSVETDAATSFGSPTTVGSVTPAATGTYEVLLSADGIAKLDSTAAAIRVKATLGGTTPSITYGAFVSPVA